MVANLPYVSEDEDRAWRPRSASSSRARPSSAAPPGWRRSTALLGELALAEPLPGAVALEVGAGQAPTVAELVRRAGFERVEARRDLAGIERMVVGGCEAERSEAEARRR